MCRNVVSMEAEMALTSVLAEFVAALAAEARADPAEVKVGMLTCAYCLKSKNQRDGFPSSMYAECWQCVWDKHHREKHPLPWSRRRNIRRVARKVARNELIKSAESELAAVRFVGELLGDKS